MQRWFNNNLTDYVLGSSENVDRSLIRKTINDKVDIIRKHQRTESRDCDGGIYVGVGGVAFMFFKLATSPAFADERSQFIQLAEYYLNPALVYAAKVKHGKDMANLVGFLLGNSGVYATAALIGSAMGSKSLMDEMLKNYADMSKYVVPVNYLACGGDELLVGRAGYLSGLLTLRKSLNHPVVSDDIVQQIFNSMLTSGREYARKHRSHSPLMYAYYDTEYLGAAHGLSGILQMMLSFPKCFANDKTAEKDIRGAVDYMLSLQQPNGNFACAVDEINRRHPNNELVHWCHGAPGVVYLMAKAFLTWSDERYLTSCIQCAELVWQKGLLRKGPGICHGVAGNAYTFLLLYRLTKDVKYLHRAARFADFMLTSEFKQGARTPDSPYSLYEGLAGTICFLDDLLQPEQAHFPLFDVF